MADFNDSHKAEQGQYFSEGTHKVTILGVEGGTNENGKEYIEFIVGGKDGEEGSARMWFTSDKAIAFTFNSIRNIFVHNASKGKEEAAKELVNKVTNSDELVGLCNKALIGKEAWYTVEISDYTYTNQAGELKHGYNRNITGYEPKPKQSGVKAVDETFGGGTVLTDEEVPVDL
jgi:hypothetical protein